MDGVKLWFWFKGVPPEREGGPWWDRAFYCSNYKSAYERRQEFLDTMRPFLHAYAKEDPSDPNNVVLLEES